MDLTCRLSFRKTEVFLLSFLLVILVSFFTATFTTVSSGILAATNLEMTDNHRNDHSLSLPVNTSVAPIILAEESLGSQKSIWPVLINNFKKPIRVSYDIKPLILTEGFINLLPEKVHLYDLFCDWQYDFVA